MAKPPPRAAQFKQFLRDAARDLGVKPRDRRAQTLATVRLQRAAIVELMQASLLSGKLADPSKLLDADDKLARLEHELRPARDCKVEIVLVPPSDAAPAGAAAVSGLRECRRCRWKPDGTDVVSRCYRCGWRQGDDTSASWSAPLWGDAVAKPFAPPPDNVAPIRSIHDAPTAPVKQNLMSPMCAVFAGQGSSIPTPGG